MGLGVCIGAIAQCPFGAAPTPLTFLPSMVMSKSGPMGTTINCVPFLNIVPFGVCMSILNPVTAALTSAAFGVLTPGPCLPVPVGTWIPEKPTVVSKMGPLISNNSTLTCAYGGVIKIIMPAQFMIMV